MQVTLRFRLTRIADGVYVPGKFQEGGGLMRIGTGLLAASGVALALSISAAALQDRSPAEAATPLVIRVGVDLIQIDATVTDKKGRPVSDLRLDEFTLEVDGRKRDIGNLVFFGAPNPDVTAPRGDESGTVRPAPSLRENTVVFVIDDLNMSFASMHQTRRGLRKFASEWGETRTRAALRITSDESPAFTLFGDAAQFEAAAAGLRYNIRSDKGMRSVRPMMSERGMTAGMATAMRENLAPIPSAVLANLQQRLTSLVTTINSLRSLPGRKAVVLVSEGFTTLPIGSAPLASAGALGSLFLGEPGIHEELRLITEVANRASVVLYAVDPRGLIVDLPGAADDPTPDQLNRVVQERWTDRVVSQASLQELADSTGGLAIANRNDLKGGFGDVLRDQSSYYLVGFEPAEQTFKRKSGDAKFHKIKLSVKRPGLRVRTRAGFYGVTDEEVNAPASRVRPQPQDQP